MGTLQGKCPLSKGCPNKLYTFLFIIISHLPLQIQSKVRTFLASPVHAVMHNVHRFIPRSYFVHNITKSVTNVKIKINENNIECIKWEKKWCFSVICQDSIKFMGFHDFVWTWVIKVIREILHIAYIIILLKLSFWRLNL